jgi:ferredoxin-NADP reductase
MVQRRAGSIVYREDLSRHLMILRLMPEAGSRFPPSKAGQYIALSSDDCELTTKIGVGSDGKALYGPALDESGARRKGTITHSYSIASAPWEQETHGYLEFYIALQSLRDGSYGRLSSAFVKLDPANDRSRTLGYVDRIVGAFTLEDRTRGYENVLMVGTGSGLAPFAAMTKQLHHDATTGQGDRRRYTLLHTNRTSEELGYHKTLQEIEDSGTFDFVYIPTVSRPTDRDRSDPTLGLGRANNILRTLFGLSTREEEVLEETGRSPETTGTGPQPDRPELPAHVSAQGLAARIVPATTKILACGNPAGLSDMRQTAERCGVAFEKEDW